MRCRRFIFASALVAAVLACGLAAWAGGPRGPVRAWGGRAPRPGRGAKAAANARTPIDDFERMTPEQQQRALDRLPPQERQRFEQRLQRFNQLPTARQQSLRNEYNRLNELSPERQKAVRNAMNRFSQQPPERQQAMREELRGMAGLSDQEREARMASPEFRSRLSRKEQGIVKDMAPLVGR